MAVKHASAVRVRQAVKPLAQQVPLGRGRDAGHLLGEHGAQGHSCCRHARHTASSGELVRWCLLLLVHSRIGTIQARRV